MSSAGLDGLLERFEQSMVKGKQRKPLKAFMVPGPEELKESSIEFEDDLSFESQSSFSQWDQNGNKEITNAYKKRSKEINFNDPKIKLISEITNNFKLTFNQVKDDSRFQSSHLKGLSKNQIIKIINNIRRRRSFRQNGNSESLETASNNTNLKKRVARVTNAEDLEHQKLKRFKTDGIDDFVNSKESVGETLLLNFITIDDLELKSEMVKSVNQLLKSNPKLYQRAIEKQASVHLQEAIEYYQQREEVKLIELLSSLNPCTAILLNIQISLVNTNLQEEGYTLSRTLLPYLNQCSNYDFLPEESFYIMIRFLNSLAQNIQDTKQNVGTGFMIIALNLNPEIITNFVNINNNQETLRAALQEMEFSDSVCDHIISFPIKFLWSHFLKVIKGKHPNTIQDCVSILSKLEVITDPGEHLNQLLDIFAQRRLICDLLQQKKEIKMTLVKLLIVLENIKRLNSETIQYCLEQEQSKWEQISNQCLNKVEDKNQQISNEVLLDLYQKLTTGVDQVPSFDEMQNVSKELSNEIEDYKHCSYQAAIASILITQKQNFVIAVVPTGSGKTWIQGLIAKYYCDQGKTVSIVEPNELLTQQTQEKLSLIHYAITVQSISDFYKHSNDADVVILDEYDQTINQKPYIIPSSSISGIWQLKEKKVFAFTATSATEIERLVSNCISVPKVMKFQSEYELIHGTSPIQDGNIKVFKQMGEVMNELAFDIEKHYDKRPIILIVDKEQEDQISDIIKNQNYRHFKGVSTLVLAEIKDLDQGILILNPNESRGIDTKFGKDAIVLIIAKVQTYSEYLQMLGRGSRTRGISNGILYSTSDEKPNVLIQRLRKGQITVAIELEKLLTLLKQKSNNKQLVEALKQQQENGSMIRQLSELEQIMTAKNYQQLLKDVKFGQRH